MNKLLLVCCLLGAALQVSCNPAPTLYLSAFSPLFGNEGSVHFGDPIPQNPNLEAKEVIVEADRDGVYVIQFLLSDNNGNAVI